MFLFLNKNFVKAISLLLIVSFLITNELKTPQKIYAQQYGCTFTMRDSSGAALVLDLGQYGNINLNTQITADMTLSSDAINRLGSSTTPHVAFKYQNGDWTFLPASYNSQTRILTVSFSLSQIDGVDGDFTDTSEENFTRYLELVATSGDANTPNRDLCQSQTFGVNNVYDNDDTITQFDGICRQAGVEGSTLYQKCIDCYNQFNKDGVWTAFGCFNVGNQNELIRSAVTLAVSIAGGFALLLILFGAFNISTSASNPEKLKLGQEIITAAVTGLIFIVLSVAIMQFIGVTIFQIPGL